MKKLLLIFIMFCSIASNAQTIPSYIPTSGLLAWWPFNGNANDESGNGHNGTVTGGTTLFSDRYGIAASAYAFNGVNGHIDVFDSLSLRLDSTDYSISVWVNFSAFSGQDLISKRNAGPANGYALSNNNIGAGANRLAMVFSQLGTDSIAYSNMIPIASWHNITVTYNYTSQILRFYIDGIFDDSTLNIPTPNPACNANLRFGGDVATNSHWHNGKLDDIGMWNRELTTTEIQAIFNGVTGINEYTTSAITLYPNPNNGIFTIRTNQKSKNKIIVYDVLGNIVKQSEINNDVFTLDISEQPKGIYFVKIQTGNESITKKIVRE